MNPISIQVIFTSVRRNNFVCKGIFLSDDSLWDPDYSADDEQQAQPSAAPPDDGVAGFSAATDFSDVESSSEDSDQNEDNDDELDGDWGPPKGKQPQVSAFTHTVGVKFYVAEMMADSSPVDFYYSLVDSNLFSHVAEQTNLYATQVLTQTKDTSAKSRLHEWTPTDEYEIKRFFGLISYMGIVRMPHMSSYWSREKMFRTTMASDCMSRNRFELLLRMVHFSNNEESNGDRLYKIKPIVDMLVYNFQSVYEPSETICIDESLVPFRGRLIMRQYIQTKRHRYGIKVFKLCSTGGYTYNFMVYAGKNLEQEKTTPSSVVMKLCEPLLNTGRTLVTDNWYTSIELAEKLLENGTHIVGTLRKNRKFLPKQLVKAKLHKGELKTMENSKGISVFKWRDKRDVMLLSTKHTSTLKTVANRYGTEMTKPTVILDYNSGKSSVDISDQMVAYQSPLRKSIKWYRKLVIEMVLNTAMVNARILYNEVTKSNINMLEFRKIITYQLCASIREENSQPDVPTTSTEKRKRHEIGVKPYNKRRPCSTCYEKLKNEAGWKAARNLKRIRTYCQGCENEPFFCIECFNKFHRNPKLQNAK